jgi:hypothetical protein
MAKIPQSKRKIKQPEEKLFLIHIIDKRLIALIV